jgi:UTP--glucose-1-phosphate uridylyltransferase
MKKVRKAVIPAAGLGTRFFPATKTIPKEMLPIVDKPTILYVVEEAMQAGIEDIILIAGRGKHSIEDFFDLSYEVEDKLVKEGKESILKSLNDIRSKVNIISIRQKSALGLGHAIQCAKSVVGDEPFAVLLGDEITLSDSIETNVTAHLAKQYELTNSSSVWVLPVEAKDTHKYGIVDLGEKKFSELNEGQQVLAVVEKPQAELAPSLWALPGRYVFNSEIFKYLDQIKTGAHGEFQLSDAMNFLAQHSKMNAYSFKTRRFDAGDKIGFVIANIEVALDRPDLKDDLIEYLNKKLQSFRK